MPKQVPLEKLSAPPRAQEDNRVHKKKKRHNKKQRAQDARTSPAAVVPSSSPSTSLNPSAAASAGHTVVGGGTGSVAASQQLTPLQSAMKAKLEAAQFRWLNERLYVLSSAEAWALLQAQPELFALYHRGFALQVKSWPLHPLDVIISQLRAVGDRRLTIADLGCGEARLAQELEAQHTVHSFDLVAANARVTAADIMRHVPLADDAVDVAVLCLALMGTNLVYALAEARRILRPGGLLKIAEVASRFSAASMTAFLAALRALDFKLIARYSEHKAQDYFVLLTFKLGPKRTPIPDPLPQLELKPCLYKKR